MQYNIAVGFHSIGLVFERERMIHAKKLVKKEDPDILIINEASFGEKDSSGRYVDYRKLFKFPYFAYIPNKHSRIGNAIAIFSKFSIESSRNFSKRKVTFGRLKIKKGEKIINLETFHPHPSQTEQQKVSFLKKNLKKIKKNYLLIGDFNSLSSEDRYNKPRLINAFSRISGEKLIKHYLTNKTVSFVLKQKLIDTFKAKNKKFDYTVPTDYLTKDKRSGIRIDYIFCSGDFEIIDSGIIKNKLTEKASDHYPIYAILEI